MKPKPKTPKRKAIPCWAVTRKNRPQVILAIFPNKADADVEAEYWNATVHRGKFVFERGKEKQK